MCMVNQHLIVINLGSVATSKVLVMEFNMVKVLENLNLI